MSRTMSHTASWGPDTWRSKPILQQPIYEETMKTSLDESITKIKELPPLVHPNEINTLNASLAKAVRGEVFVIQGGDCVETFADCNSKAVEAKLKIMLQMALIVTWSARIPVVKIGRIGGQYGKPRSSPYEQVKGGDDIMSFKGENINGYEATPEARKHDPKRLLEAHYHSASTLNYIRALLTGDYADLHQASHWDLGEVKDTQKRTRYQKITRSMTDALDFLETVGYQDSSVVKSTQFYFSHEGLILEYESAVTRKVNDKYYNVGAHMLWIGNRTRALDGAHVEYFRGISNPIGIKVGIDMDPLDLVHLINILNPSRIPGKITLITRYGRKNVQKSLSLHIRAIQKAGLSKVILWSCDPMHGNTYKAESGYKTRNVDEIIGELVETFKCHLENGSRLGGIHVELTGENVTECVGGPQQLLSNDLRDRYVTYCDPRLNYLQSMEMSFLMGDLLREREHHDEDEGDKRLESVSKLKNILLANRQFNKMSKL